MTREVTYAAAFRGNAFDRVGGAKLRIDFPSFVNPAGPANHARGMTQRSGSANRFVVEFRSSIERGDYERERYRAK